MKDNLILDIGRRIKGLMIQDPFYGMFISSIKKMECTTIPLAAVSLNLTTREVTLLINPDKWFELPENQRLGVMHHEALHLCFFHLFVSDMYPNKKMHNIATDLEINSIVKLENLPDWVIKPHEFQKRYPKLNFSPNKGSDHYYKELKKLTEEEQDELGISEEAVHRWIFTDESGMPCNPTEVELDFIKNIIAETVENLARECREIGNVPVEIDTLIRGFKKPKPKYNYKKFIRNFIGNGDKYQISFTRNKENQRFSGNPKMIQRPTQKLLVLIDMSGSMGPELEEAVNEVYHLKRIVDLEIRAFDVQVSEPIKYKGGDSFKRVKSGGTDLGCAVDFFNLRSDFDTMIVFTDGLFHPVTPPNKRCLIVISSTGDMSSISNFKYKIKLPTNG